MLIFDSDSCEKALSLPILQAMQRMVNLEKKLAEWAKHGLIDQQQAAQINTYEQSAGRAAWVMYGAVGVGVIVLMTGIISIVAANWEAITPNTKLISYFVVQILLALCVFRQSDHPGIIREALITFAALFFFAGIGLAGQTFNLRSDGWQAFAFWMLLTLPALWIANSRLIYHIWFGTFVLTTMLFVAFSDNAWVQRHPEGTYLIIVALPFLWAAFGFARSLLPIPELFGKMALFWSFLYLAFGLLPIASGAWYGAGYEDSRHLEDTRGYLLFTFGSALLASASVFTIKPRCSARLRVAMIGMLISLVLFAGLPILLHPQDEQIISCAGFITVLGFAAAAAALAGRKPLFDLLTLVITVRFLIIYFEVFGSLAATGLGLIVSGLVILGTTYLWHRFRMQFVTLFERREGGCT